MYTTSLLLPYLLLIPATWLPLSSSLYLPTALIRHTTTTTLTTSTPTCWSPTSRFPRITFHDCLPLINTEITRQHSHLDPSLPLKFSADPALRPDLPLPTYWNRAGVNCGIGIDFAPRQRGYDRATLEEVRAAAMALAVECVIKAPHTGGYVRVGWFDKLGVLISGARAPAPPPPSLSPSSLGNGTTLVG